MFMFSIFGCPKSASRAQKKNIVFAKKRKTKICIFCSLH